ncbi:MAG: nicotinate-nucleotide adenylyltransferase [Thermomicrobiales bacterium]
MTHATSPASTIRRPRIGVFGGTFDPVHKGHLHIANGMRDQLELERIVWVPAGRPPHKLGQIVSSDEDRLAMLELALRDLPQDTISRIEVDRPGPSYTADTLQQLAAELAPAELVFLMGEDSLRDFPNWRDPDRILAHASLGVAQRPGIDANLQVLTQALPALCGRVHLANIPELPVSSSEIRARVARGESITHLTPEPVAQYIRDHGLYLPAAG